MNDWRYVLADALLCALAIGVGIAMGRDALVRWKESGERRDDRDDDDREPPAGTSPPTGIR